MSAGEIIPTGHSQVKADSRGKRSYYVYWTDAHGKHGRRLGPRSREGLGSQDSSWRGRLARRRQAKAYG